MSVWSALKGLFSVLFSRKSAVRWTAIFTGVLAVFTWKLFDVTKQNTENTAMSQRAFVNFKDITLLKVMTADGQSLERVSVYASWENSGNTPAETAITRVNWGTTLPAEFGDVKEAEVRSFVIGPKAIVVVPLLNPTAEVVRAYQEYLRKGKHFYFWGWVTYKDVFYKTPYRLTEFCEEVVNVEISKSDVNIALTGCRGKYGKHNCYDGDCPGYEDRIKAALMLFGSLS